MNTKMIRYLLGITLLIEAGLILCPLLVALLYGEPIYPFLITAGILVLISLPCVIFKPKNTRIFAKEGFVCVASAWLLMSVFGTIPFVLSGAIPNVISAFFETVSGFTTTGSSILNDIEFLPRGMLFWRAASAWIGGVGVVMFALVILPSMGRSRHMLSNVELSTIAKDNFHYRSRVIIRILTMVYVGLTACTTLALKLAGMTWFDATTQAMSACATCGFSTKNLSVGFWDNPMIEAILMAAMTLSAIHFGILYASMTGRKNNIFRSEVVRTFIGMMTIIAVAISLSLLAEGIYDNWGESFRHSAFQVVSVTTTSGFATADTNTWTPLAIMLLIICSVVCGCAGSTSGGMKVDRMLIASKIIRNRMKVQLHPNAVIRTKVDGAVQDEGVQSLVMTFIVAYIMTVLLGTIIYTMFGLDLVSSLTASIACVSNVGPGFGEVGSLDNFSALPAVLKFNSTVLMLIGRLEIFGFIQLLFIRSWR